MMATRQATRPIRIESILRRWVRRDAHQEEAGRKFQFDNMEDLVWPREVWAAVEGDRAPLLTLLRGNEKLGRHTRNALADWIEGKLTPIKLRRGGHRQETKVSRAWYRYDKAHDFIRGKGWNRKGASRYWPAEKLLKVVAQKEGVAEAALKVWVRRSKPQASVAELMKYASSEQRIRESIAREIRNRE